MNKIIELEKELTLFINQDLRNSLFDFVLPIFSEINVLVVLLLIFFAWYAYYLNTHKEEIYNEGEKPLHYFIAFFLFLVLSVVITNLLSDLIKDIVNKPRPAQALPEVFYQSKGLWKQTSVDIVKRLGGTSFISSHASNCMAVATCFYLYFKRTPILIFLVPVIVSWSRIYLGKHYFIDVTCGMAFGFIVAYAFFKILKKYVKIFDKI